MDWLYNWKNRNCFLSTLAWNLLYFLTYSILIHKQKRGLRKQELAKSGTDDAEYNIINRQDIFISYFLRITRKTSGRNRMADMALFLNSQCKMASLTNLPYFEH